MGSGLIEMFVADADRTRVCLPVPQDMTVKAAEAMELSVEEGTAVSVLFGEDLWNTNSYH